MEALRELTLEPHRGVDKVFRAHIAFMWGS